MEYDYNTYCRDYAEDVAEEIECAARNGFMDEYLEENILEVKMVCTYPDRKVDSYILERTVGGPHCWIDTKLMRVYCDYAGHTESYKISDNAVAEIIEVLDF